MREFGVGGGSEDDPPAGEERVDAFDDLAEAFGGPAFRRAILGAGAEADENFVFRRIPLRAQGRGRDGPAMRGDPPVAIRVVFRLAELLLRRRDDLVEEGLAVGPFEPHTPRDAGEPDLHGRPEGIGEKHRRVEAPAQFSGDGNDGVLFRKLDDFIHLGDPFPEPGKFGGSQHGEPDIRAAGLEGPRGAEAHHRIPEPVR